MVLLLDLDLVKCSDRIDNISLADITKVVYKDNNTKTLKNQYANRTTNLHLSLHEYYHYMKNQNKSKNYDCWNIPHIQE